MIDNKMNKPKLIMLIGLPASGKSYIAQQLQSKYNFNATIHSSDSIREELLNNINSQENNDLVFQTLHSRIKSDLTNNINTIYDATNISYKRRMTFLQSLNKIECEKIAYFIATPYTQCLEWNNTREHKVPEDVIRRMYLNFDIPAYFEGWDDIQIVNNSDSSHNENYTIQKVIDRLCTIPHENPHHTLSIGNHCLKCHDLLLLEGFRTTEHFERNLVISGLLHDIGKEFTKEFKNSKGEPSPTAHYYQHHHVSAYEAIFYLMNVNVFPFSKSEILDICQLIRWHMQPYFMPLEKTRNKFIKLVGQEFYDRLMILNKADIEAH